MYAYLHTTAAMASAAGGAMWDVRWVNQDGESTLPYDIVLTNPADKGNPVYVEVKTTQAQQKVRVTCACA